MPQNFSLEKSDKIQSSTKPNSSLPHKTKQNLNQQEQIQKLKAQILRKVNISPNFYIQSPPKKRLQISPQISNFSLPIQKILERNKQWATKTKKQNPDLFQKLSLQQKPQFLWVGCSDSRVPAEILTDSGLGELFVHRNIANQVIHTDFNCLSVVQYAVEVLQVSDIIICGHYKCGGINAALKNNKDGVINYWLFNIRDLYLRFKDKLDKIEDMEKISDKMSELNALQQVYNLGNSSILQNAWKKGQKIQIHAIMYNIDDGIIKVFDYLGDNQEFCDHKYNEIINQLID